MVQAASSAVSVARLAHQPQSAPVATIIWSCTEVVAKSAAQQIPFFQEVPASTATPTVWAAQVLLHHALTVLLEPIDFLTDAMLNALLDTTLTLLP